MKGQIDSGTWVAETNSSGKVELIWTTIPETLVDGMAGKLYDGEWVVESGLICWTTVPTMKLEGMYCKDNDGIHFVYLRNSENVLTKYYLETPTTLTTGMVGLTDGGEWKVDASGNQIWVEEPSTLTPGMKGEEGGGTWEVNESGEKIWITMPTTMIDGLVGEENNGKWNAKVSWTEAPVPLVAGISGTDPDGSTWVTEEIDGTVEKIYTSIPQTLVAGMKGQSDGGKWYVDANNELVWSETPTYLDDLIVEKDGGEYILVPYWITDPSTLTTDMRGFSENKGEWIVDENNEKIYVIEPTVLESGMKGKADGGEWYVNDVGEKVWTVAPSSVESGIGNEDDGVWEGTKIWTTSPTTLAPGMRGEEDGGEWYVNESGEKTWIIAPNTLTPGMKGETDNGTWEVNATGARSINGTRVWSESPSIIDNSETGYSDNGEWRATQIWVDSPTTLTPGMKGEEDGGEWYVNESGEKTWTVAPNTLTPGMKGEEGGGTWEVNESGEKIWTTQPEGGGGGDTSSSDIYKDKYDSLFNGVNFEIIASVNNNFTYDLTSTLVEGEVNINSTTTVETTDNDDLVYFTDVNVDPSLSSNYIRLTDGSGNKYFVLKDNKPSSLHKLNGDQISIEASTKHAFGDSSGSNAISKKTSHFKMNLSNMIKKITVYSYISTNLIKNPNGYLTAWIILTADDITKKYHTLKLSGIDSKCTTSKKFTIHTSPTDAGKEYSIGDIIDLDALGPLEYLRIGAMSKVDDNVFKSYTGAVTTNFAGWVQPTIELI